jgi:oxalate decarboxylase
VSEWFTHTPPDILAENFGVPAETFKDIPLRDLYIFQGNLPGDLAADRAAVSGSGAPPHPFTFSLASGSPARETKGGTVHIADSRNFTVSTTIAAALLTIRPRGMREMHWHPNADEWQYWIKGKGTMTVFDITLYMQAAQDITIGARLNKTQFQYTFERRRPRRTQPMGGVVPRQDQVGPRDH